MCVCDNAKKNKWKNSALADANPHINIVFLTNPAFESEEKR